MKSTIGAGPKFILLGIFKLGAGPKTIVDVITGAGPKFILPFIVTGFTLILGMFISGGCMFIFIGILDNGDMSICGIIN